MNTPWPPQTATRVWDALLDAATRVGGLQASAEHYSPDGGYGAVLATAWSSVYGLEVRLGPSHHKPGHSIHALFQVFDPDQPNLAFLRVIERRDLDGRPTVDPRVPLYNRTLDRTVCQTVMPVFNSALNRLDPAGRGHSIHVDCWQGRTALSDLPSQPARTTGLLRRFRHDGQAAIIWTDFHDPLAEAAVRLLRPVVSRRDVHLIPRTRIESALRTPVRSRQGGVWSMPGISTAAEEGIQLARRYLQTTSLAGRDRPTGGSRSFRPPGAS